MVELRHHPNIISLRFVKVSGSEFLMIMDVVGESKELSEAYQDGTVWSPLCQDRNVSRTTSFLSMLWYQLAHALDHLHRKFIMVYVAILFIFAKIFLMNFDTPIFVSTVMLSRTT